MSLLLRQYRALSFKKAGAFIVLALAIVCLNGCSSSLNLTSTERSILECHRDADPSGWRYGDENEIKQAIIESKKRWLEFANAFNGWTNAEEKKKSGNDKLSREECFEVKIPLMILLMNEDMWMHVTAIDKNTITGKLDQTPICFSWYHAGSTITVPISDVEDWAYGNDDQPTGAFTTSVIRRAKLQELNQLVLVNGEPTLASVLACNNYWQKLIKKWDQPEYKSSKILSKQDEKELVLCTECGILITDESSRLRCTEKNNFSEKAVARACGLPLSTIQLIQLACTKFPKEADKKT